MTTFVRNFYPFSVQASIDSATPDLKVSTDGTVELGATNVQMLANAGVALVLSATDLVVGTTAVLGALKFPVTISGSVSVKVTAAGFFTITDVAGVEWRIPAFTTLA